jgi:hypothetical protein
MAGTGTATIDFGAHPGTNEASVAVAVPAITAGAKVEAFIMADDTSADHTASDHQYVGLWLNLTCGAASAGVGFTLYGRASEKLTGEFSVRYVWTE